MIQKPRKTQRNEMFDKYLNDGLTPQQAYDAILAENSDLLTINKGKGEKERLTQLVWVIKDHRNWLKDNGPQK